MPPAELLVGPAAVLDAEALSVLASPRERGAALRRAQAVLEAIEHRAGYAITPAPILAETSRTRARRAAVDRVLQSVRVVSTDRVIAATAGVLLEAAGMDSTNAIDAFVVATAAQLPVAVILTADVDGVASLAASLRHVEVRALA